MPVVSRWVRLPASFLRSRKGLPERGLGLPEPAFDKVAVPEPGSLHEGPDKRVCFDFLSRPVRLIAHEERHGAVVRGLRGFRTQLRDSVSA